LPKLLRPHRKRRKRRRQSRRLLPMKLKAMLLEKRKVPARRSRLRCRSRTASQEALQMAELVAARIRRKIRKIRSEIVSEGTVVKAQVELAGTHAMIRVENQ